jgi:hypothetical protein
MNPMKRSALVRMYMLIDAVDRVYLEIEEVMREPPLSADADVQAEVEQLVGCLSELYEGGGDALKRVRSQAAVEDDGSSCRPRGDGGR